MNAVPRRESWKEEACLAVGILFGFKFFILSLHFLPNFSVLSLLSYTDCSFLITGGSFPPIFFFACRLEIHLSSFSFFFVTFSTFVFVCSGLGVFYHFVFLFLFFVQCTFTYLVYFLLY